jgi:multidrug efflux system membrane fusion protein
MRRWLGWAACGFVGIAAVLGGILLVQPKPGLAADPAEPASVPVTTATAQIQDVPVMLGGLGTVQPLNVVEIKAQVNGTLIALPVTEGQEVHKDQILAEIDPRPYKAALDQAVAQRDEDAALLHSAQLDLKRFQDQGYRRGRPGQRGD